MEYQAHSLGLLALGANLPTSAGNPSDSLRIALQQLTRDGVQLRRVSRFWKTPAFPAGSGPDYINAAAVVATSLPPRELLDWLHLIEAGLGRKRDGGRWQARGIDIDLIAYDGMILPDLATQDSWRNLPPERQLREAPDQLILPHPRMQERGFVLAPLAEVAPLWRHPIIGANVQEMLAALPSASLEGMQLVEA